MAEIKGGNKLANILVSISRNLDGASKVDVGFLADATYPDGTSVPLVAAIQEYGAPSRNIPPRPFFRNMIADRSSGWPAALSAVLKATDYDSRTSLEQMGQVIKGELQESINTFSGVPLSPKTIEAKGFDKQLVDTSHMLQSIDYRVK